MSRRDTRDPLVLLRQQTVLARFGELALKSDDLTEVLTEACRLIAEGLGTGLARVAELQPDGHTLLVRAGVGWNQDILGRATLETSEGTSEGHALRIGRPLVSPDIEGETRFRYPQFLIDNGIRAIANVPIIGGQDRPPFGLLQVDSRTPRHFTDEDTAFLSSYANLVAAAVDRLRVLGEVREDEERLRLALEAGKLGSWEVDLATGMATTTARITQIFGYADPPPEWSYARFLGHVLRSDRRQVVNTFRRTVGSGTEWHLQCRIRREEDGVVRWIEVQGSPAASRDGGRGGPMRPTHLRGIVADVTERKDAEQALRRSNASLEAMVVARTRELTEANARLQTEAVERERVEEALRQSSKMEAVGQLTGGLAHDFNNLLTGITGSLELIRIRAAQGRTGDFDRYIDAALSSANRVAAVTHRLLAFSRRQTLDPKLTNVNQLVCGMEELLRRTIGPSIHLETKLAGDPWLPLCDPNQLENALLNLVINARDAMPDGGSLTIQSANTILSDRRGMQRDVSTMSLPAGDYVALFITDDGVGMTPEVLGRAFDPFFTTKPIGKGTGLGLSMTYGFVQQSGGHVHLRSAAGSGTTVTIYLPRHVDGADIEVPHDLQVDEPPPEATAVVLVVEDEVTVRMLVVDTLSDLGYMVLEAGDGRSGLRIAESSTRIDLLVTDVGLPNGMNGRQLADAVRQRRPDIKVLFITGYAASAIVGNSLLDDGMQVMTKPFTMDALATRVGRIIGGASDPERLPGA